VPLDILQRCAAAPPVVLTTLAAAMMPPPRMKVSAWAEAHRIVSAESGSRYPGPWRNDRAPHLIEIMDALGPDDSAEDVVFCKSAQVAGSEVGINFFGFVVTQAPGPMIMVLPSHDESIKYVRTKLQPTIDETPSLRRKVLEVSSRSERGSTAAFKRFPGGFAQNTFAGSSKGLQMISARYTIGDEVSEWPQSAGERGDPVEQLKVRTKIFERDRKRYWCSTPAIAGTCRITKDYERSDRQKRYVPCPHCGAFQVLKFERLKWDSETWPFKAWFECAASGCVIEHLDKPAMMRAGVWLPTAGDDAPPEVFAAGDLEIWKARVVRSRIRGFHIWQAYTLFESWDSIVQQFKDAKGNHEKLRVFTQQVLGEAWEDRGDAPEAEKLHKARMIEVRRGKPVITSATGPIVFTGATDVQGNRLEWAVWGWSEGMTRWLVDWGVIPGDPVAPETWAEHSRVMQAARYRTETGGEIEWDAWAIDSGYVSQTVYNYARGRPRVFAVDGKTGRTEPFIGSPKRVDVKFNGKRIPRGVMLWPVGGFPLKADLYSTIRRTLTSGEAAGAEGGAPGLMVLPGEVDIGYCEQLTAEHLVEKEQRNGVIVKTWEKMTGRPNEALDIACYARAMAYHLKLDRKTPDQWTALRSERLAPGPYGQAGADGSQADLFDATLSDTPATPAVDARRPESGVTGKTWIKQREDWI
jgi:phage terminase large subunit GpA-like protein